MNGIHRYQRALRAACARRKRERARADLEAIMERYHDGHPLTSKQGQRAREARRQVAEANAVLEELDAG